MIRTLRCFTIPAGGRAACLLLPACLLAGCGPNSGSAPSYEEAVAAAKGAQASIAEKGKVEEKQYPPGKGHAVTLAGVTITDADIDSLRAIDNLAELDLSGATVSDQQLARLVMPRSDEGRPPARLFRINLSDTPITDEGLRELQVLNLLVEVNVKGSKVTDNGVERFRKWKEKTNLPFGLKLKVEK